MSSLLFYAIVIIVAILVVYFVTHLYNHGSLPSAPFQDSVERMKDSIGQTYDNYFTSAEDMYEQTVGHENDEAAQMAYQKAEKREKMYSRNEKFGRLSDKNLPSATATAFMLANINRFNVGPTSPAAMQTAAQQYGTVMQRIARNPTAVVAAPHIPPAEFMIDRAEDFYEDYIAHLTLDPAAIPDLDGLRDAVRVARLGVAENQVTAGNIPRRTRRRRRRGENITDKQATQDTYFEERDIRNDPQNVHESQVNNDMMRIFNRIQEQNQEDNMYSDEIIPPEQTIRDIREYINQREWSDPEKKARALQTLNKAAEGNYITKLQARESEVVANVWRRMNSPDNADNRDNLRDALMDNLADGVEKGYNGQDYQVCASGRTGRVLSSLTLIDADEEISQPIKTAEILRNEVFSKSYQIIQNTLKTADEETARAYNGVLDQPAPDVDDKVAAFEVHLKEQIDQQLRDEYSDKVEPKILDNLIQDAQAGV